MTTTDIDRIPTPGTDLVPDGWWQSTFVPWADERVEAMELAEASANLAALIAAWIEMGRDTLEFTKARRYVEVRWGELLGDAKPGPQAESSHASEDLLSKDDRYRFRQLAQIRPQIMDRLRDAEDPDEITRAALLRLKPPRESTTGFLDRMRADAADDEPSPPASIARSTPADREPTAGPIETNPAEMPEDRRWRRLDIAVDEASDLYTRAKEPGLSAFACTEILRKCGSRFREVAAAMNEMAFNVEREEAPIVVDSRHAKRDVVPIPKLSGKRR